MAWLSKNKTIERVAKAAAALPGWSLRQGAKHWRLVPPVGFRESVLIPGTPGGGRGQANFLADVARLIRQVASAQECGGPAGAPGRRRPGRATGPEAPTPAGSGLGEPGALPSPRRNEPGTARSGKRRSRGKR